MNLFMIPIILLLLASISLFVLSPITVMANKPLKNIIINPISGQNTKKCLSEILNCNDDNDCQKNCIEQFSGVQMKCVDLPKYTEEQKLLYGQSQKICAPAKAEINCNAKYGGVLSWSGFPNIENMQWDCLCSYPNLAGGPGCSLNSDVCEGGTYTWDVTDSNKSDPTNKLLCTCGPGKSLFIDPITSVPKCVPKIFSNKFNEVSTRSFYEDNYTYT